MIPRFAFAGAGAFAAILLTNPANAADAPTAQDAADGAADKKEHAQNEAARQKSGNGTNVSGESLTSTTSRSGPAERFGRKRQLAFSSDEALTFSSTTTSGVSGSTTTVELQPAVDWFVIDNLSVGGFLQLNYTSANDGHATTFGIGPRVGYNFPLSDLLSVWPKLGLSIDNTSTTTNVAVAGSVNGATTSSTHSAASIALNVFVPLMFHPAPHFFVGFGPFVDTDLSGDSKATTWGAKLTLGGWVGL